MNSSNETSITPMRDMPDILYVMGTGRSGTTILEVLLTNNPGIDGVGEVVHIFKDAYLENELCACGARAHECGVWRSIRERCHWSGADIDRAARLFRQFAWHDQFPRVACGWHSAESIQAFRSINRSLLAAFADAAGATTVVDSSKYAGRALALARAFPDRVRIILLTRTPAGLMRAFSKQNRQEQRPKKPLAALIYYVYTMTCFRVVASICGPSQVLSVRYEDLSADPASTLRRIGEWSDLDLSASIKKIENDELLNVGHIVTGNRLRHEQRIRFRRSARQEEPLGRTQQVATQFMDAYRRLLGL